MATETPLKTAEPEQSNDEPPQQLSLF
jgi:hypothetical protein